MNLIKLIKKYFEMRRRKKLHEKHIRQAEKRQKRFK